MSASDGPCSRGAPPGPAPAPREGFPKSLRLRRSADYQRVQREGRRIHLVHLVIVHRVNDLGTPRFGMAVSRKVGTAVVRNRVKRWLREGLRRQWPAVRREGAPFGVDVVLIARPVAATSSYGALASEIGTALGRIAKEIA